MAAVEDFMARNKLPHSRILVSVFVKPQFAPFWYSVFADNRTRTCGLWKVDVERETLSEDTISTGNEFCVFVDPDTFECGVFFLM